MELIMATFTTEMVTHCGFDISLHAQALRFDWDYIYVAEPEEERFPALHN
jgi:hypothetical protein